MCDYIYCTSLTGGNGMQLKALGRARGHVTAPMTVLLAEMCLVVVGVFLNIRGSKAFFPPRNEVPNLTSQPFQRANTH